MSDMSAVISILEHNPVLWYQIGDCPNVEFPTVGGQIFWKELDRKNGWKLQQNYISGLCRILDENDIRKAWGSPVTMKEKFKRLTRQEFLELGDVIGIARKKACNMYEHYGVYIGENQVVHYAGAGSDFDHSITVKVDSMDAFLKDDGDYFVLYFDKGSKTPHKIQAKTNFNTSDINTFTVLELTETKGFKIYSAKETVQRALSRVGEDKYHLLLNNCEHFAIWCKTGIAESYQVKRIIGSIRAI